MSNSTSPPPKSVGSDIVSHHVAASLLREWRRGWRPAIGTTLGYGAGSVVFLTTAGLFIQPMREATGWSTTEVLVAPWVTLMWAALSPAVGRMTSRRGARFTASVGLVGLGAILLLFAVLPWSRTTFYGMVFLVGLVGPFSFLVPFARNVTSWFRRSAGLALGVMGSGGSLVALAATPLCTLAIYQLGWRSGYLVLAGFVLLLALPAVQVLVRDPAGGVEDTVGAERSNSVPTDGCTELRSVRYWSIVLPLTIAAVVVTGFLGHLQPILLGGGLGVAAATTITSVFLLFVALGRLLGGMLLDRIWPYAIPATTFLLGAVACLALAHVGEGVATGLVAAAAAVVGFSQGAEADFPAFFVVHESGQDRFVRLFGVAAMFTTGATAVGPLMFGILRDVAGSYTLACYVSLVLFALSSIWLLMVGLRARSARVPMGPAVP